MGWHMDLFTLVGKIALEADGFNEKIDSVMSKVESLGTGLQKAGEKISSVGSTLTKVVSLPLMALGTASISTAATFEDGMLKVQSLSGATQEEYKKLSETAKQYGASTAWTAKDVADAMGYMALAGFDTNEILASTGGMLSLASASGEDLATVTDILTDSMTAFGDGAEDASRYADVLATTQAKSNTTVGLLGEAFKYVAPLAGSYKYKLEDVATALGMMANAGVKGSMAGTSLSSIITRLGTNTDGCRDVIEEMGVAFYNQDGSARNLSEVLKALADKTKNLDTEQKAALAKQIAGMEAQKGLLAILNQGSQAYKDLEKTIKSCDGAAEDMATNMESGMGGAIRSLKSALEGVSITLGEKLAPYVMKAAEKIKEFTTWFQNLDSKTQDMIVKIGLFVVAAGPVITIFGKGVTAIGSLITAGTKLVGGIGSVISVGKTLLSGGVKIVSGVGSLATKIVSGLLPALAAVPAPVWIIIGVITAVIAIGVALYKNWDTIKEKAHELKEKISEKWDEIKEKTHELTESIKEKWKGIKEDAIASVESIRENVSAKWNEIKESAHDMVEGIKEKYHEMAENLREKTEQFKAAVVEKYHEIKENAVAKFEEMKERASEKFSELKEKATARIEELRAQASEKIQNLKDSAVSHFEELREKTSAKVSAMKEKIVTDFHNLKEEASEKIADLKERWGQRFEEAREKIVSEVTELKEKATDKINEFKETAVARVSEFKETATARFREFKEETVSNLREVASRGVEGFNNIREKGSAAIESLKSTAAAKFSEMGNTIYEKFNAISSKIESTFSKARDAVHNIVEKIKGFFNFEWKLPNIKLPHFKIDGSFSLNPPSIPKFGVDWYAEGGVMTKPTAFGVNPATGNIMVGGEAGAEAIAPISVLQDYIRRAVSERDEGLTNTLNAISGVLNRYLPQLANMQLVLDTGATVGALASGMNTKLGEISRENERIK